MGLFNKEITKEIDKHDIEVQPENPIKRLYLVDYENVSDAGIVGVDTLTPNDSVIIFYGSKVKSVAYESLIAITESKANIEHLKAEKTAKNYLDFQLTTYLGFKLGSEQTNEVYIISKDSGFDAVVDFWSAKNINIKRQSAIVEPTKEEPSSEEASSEKPKRSRRTNSTRTRRTTTRTNVTTKPRTKKTTQKSASPMDKTRSELRAALKGCGLTAPEYKKVYDAFNKSASTSSYNNSLQKAFGNEKTSEIYKATNKIFEKEHK